MKDRRHRQEEADRKRLLEKAKAKSRKGKKGGRLNKGQTTSNSTASAHGEDTEQLESNDTTPMNAGHGSTTDPNNDSSGDFGEENGHLCAKTDVTTQPDLVPSKDNT